MIAELTVLPNTSEPRVTKLSDCILICIGIYRITLFYDIMPHNELQNFHAFIDTAPQIFKAITNALVDVGKEIKIREIKESMGLNLEDKLA